MSIFDKQTEVFMGKSKSFYQDCQTVLRDANIRFKAYAIEDSLKNGCCGTCSNCLSHIGRFTYSVFVKAKDAEAARLRMQGLARSQLDDAMGSAGLQDRQGNL
jgi:hypothetical protein